MLEALRDPEYLTDMMLPTEFVARPSCGPAPVPARS
jgi:hypothetical protein